MRMYKKNEGAILIIVLFTVVILLLVGITFIFWLRIESRSATQKRAATKDFFYGELGSEKTIHRMLQPGATDPGGFAWPFVNLPSGNSEEFTLIIDGVSVKVHVQEIP